jgi:hypothetical protein
LDSQNTTPLFRGVMLAGGTLRFQYRTDNHAELGGGVWDTTKTINDGAWHHVVFLRSGRTFQVYIDGNVAKTGTANNSFTTMTTPKQEIGAYSYFGSYGGFWKGQMDDVRIYNRALSAAEVQSLYAGAANNPLVTNLSLAPIMTTGISDISSRTTPTKNGGSGTAIQGQSLTSNATAAHASDSALEAVMLWIEAEEGMLQAPLEVVTDADASAANYVWGPDGNGDVWNPFQPGGVAQYTFEIPKTDTYVIWGRVSPNTEGTGSFFLAVDVAPEETTLATDVSPSTYQVASLHAGETYYIDSPHTITAMPAELADLVAVKTANADKHSRKAESLTLTITQDATLYVAYDAQATRLPTWLTTSYTQTGLTINTTNGHMAVWRKEAPAGTIALPGNAYQGSRRAHANYFVLLAPHGQSPSLVWEIVPSAASASWIWDQAASDTMPVFFLEAGTHTLTIKQREEGTKLDKLFITNDMDTVPQD